jgi:hypothetical protein
VPNRRSPGRESSIPGHPFANVSLSSACDDCPGRKQNPLISTKTGQNRRSAVASLILASAMVISACQESRPPSSSSQPPPAEAVPAPEITQAKWKIKTRSVARVGKLSKKQKRRLDVQRPRVKGVVREVYEALFLEPESMQQIISGRFSRGAARAMLQSGAGFRPGAERVKTLTRRANIGIQAHTASAAAARILVRARARGSGSVVRLRHRATMWMQREGDGWQVIGFEVDQGRIR